MIKCIIFDLGNVLVRNNPSKWRRKLSQHCIGPVFAKKDSIIVAPLIIHRLMSEGKISNKAFYRKVVRKSERKNFTQKKFERIYADMFTANVPVQSLARRLKKKYELLLLSDTDEIQFSHIRKKFPVLGIFRRHILSCRVGCKKPAMPIYRAAIEKSGCRPEECVFIDDKAKNVDGAKRAGMRGIHHTTTAKLKRSLRSFGVKF